MGYSRILAHYPYVVVGMVMVFAGTCLVISITVGSVPDFSDPQAGFEVRGNELSQRYITWENLLDKTNTDMNPYYTFPKQQISQHATSHNGTGNKGRSKRSTSESYYFCGSVPGMNYARVVFHSTDGSDLFALHHIHAMCRIEQVAILQHPLYAHLCIAQDPGEAPCCQRSWSLGNYIALLTNRSSCSDITQQDVDYMAQVIHTCSGYYHNSSLQQCFHGNKQQCSAVPSLCRQHDAIYHLLHYITDVKFSGHNGIGKLRYAVSFLPISGGKDTVDIFHDMKQQDLVLETTAIAAIDFGIKHILFSNYLQYDTLWLGLSLVMVLLFMWLYTTSFFITAMTMLSILLALDISYFFYKLVFEIPFFPFMNLMTIVILIGIGADDMFIYVKVWNLSKSEKNNGTLEKIVSDTLKHATLSMFVTSFTTAAALFSNYVSHITSLKCFAIYAGITILANFLLMVTWIPATIVMYEKWCSNCCVCYSPDIYTSKRGVCYYLCKIPYKVYFQVVDSSRVFFEKLLPCVVIRLRLFCVIVLGLLGIGGLIVIFYRPRLKLPSSHEFQVFSSEHYFEVYDFQLKDEFYFEKAAGESVHTLPMTVVFGVVPQDNGNYLAPRDPNNRGTLVCDRAFNIAHPTSQIWMKQFCRKLRATPFYRNAPGLQLTNCYIESLEEFAKRKCITEEEKCCDYEFPIPEKNFMTCVNEWAPSLTRTKARFPHNKYAGMRYSKESSDILAAVIQFDSNVPFSYKYDDIHNYYTKMRDWVENQLQQPTVPPGLKTGWFISELEFYNLQDSILHGAPLSIGVAVAVALGVTFLTTLNLLISLYASFSIIATISVTIATLTLLGWELNILESVTLTIAVGLSMDFTLHYGVAYRLSPDLDREMRVYCATSRMGTPIAMAALTTFLAGAMMMPSTVLAYRQLGTFLMLVMTFSWLYATFFFQSLLCLFGPRGGFGQFHWPSLGCCSGHHREHVDKTVYAMSESGLSSSSTSYPNHSTVTTSEIHELEPLNESEAEYIQDQLKSPHLQSQNDVKGTSEAAIQEFRGNSEPLVSPRAKSRAHGKRVSVSLEVVEIEAASMLPRDQDEKDKPECDQKLLH